MANLKATRTVIIKLEWSQFFTILLKNTTHIATLQIHILLTNSAIFIAWSK